MKLATELSSAVLQTPYTGQPTTGLHALMYMLIEVLQRLAEGEYRCGYRAQSDMIKVADYIIDLGPEGGDRGGMVRTGSLKNC